MVPFKIESCLNHAQILNKKNKVTHQIILIGNEDKNYYSRLLSDNLAKNQIEKYKNKEDEVVSFEGTNSYIWIIRPKINTNNSHYGLFKDTGYTKARDIIGEIALKLKKEKVASCAVDFFSCDSGTIEGALVGIDLAWYDFKDFLKGDSKSYFLKFYFDSSQVTKDQIKNAQALAHAMNVSRHLVNLPPNIVNPQSMISIVKSLFKKSASVKVDVWNHLRLKKEGMNLHYAVGQGAEHLPCMIHIQYRPKKTKSSKKSTAPIAFVGKGVTFDTGGLDIKPSSGMRWMKKDMGGSASVLGIAIWAAQTNYHAPLDFYLGYAENAVDAKSFRPSDILQARNGDWVEIHNTDAEGRLVLADCLDVAVTQKEKPKAVINIATLTGAIKVALGADVPGMFSNDDELSDSILKSSAEVGETFWRMPLVQKYVPMMKSNFADYTNCTEGFGGAVTAALFLEKFVRKVPWVHLDIYSWTDKSGPFAAGGGNAQCVQSFAHYLKNQ